MRTAFSILFLLGAAITGPASAGVNSLFLNGLTFFDSGDFDETSGDIRAGDLSPGFDGDFLLTFRDSKKTSILAGFGIFWSRRLEEEDRLPGEEKRGKIEMLGFPFSVGFARRAPADSARGWVWGAMAHYYFFKVSVEVEPGETAGWFRIDGTSGERDAAGPAVSGFAAYEIPFFLGRIGAGVKGRYASVAVSDEQGLATPAFSLSGVTLFLSAALR